MLEQKALAYANMYGVLGALENLCVLDSKAKEIVNGINKPYILDRKSTRLNSSH